MKRLGIVVLCSSLTGCMSVAQRWSGHCDAPYHKGFMEGGTRASIEYEKIIQEKQQEIDELKGVLHLCNNEINKCEIELNSILHPK